VWPARRSLRHLIETTIALADRTIGIRSLTENTRPCLITSTCNSLAPTMCVVTQNEHVATMDRETRFITPLRSRTDPNSGTN
jgi:hypothetical protein